MLNPTIRACHEAIGPITHSIPINSVNQANLPQLLSHTYPDFESTPNATMTNAVLLDLVYPVSLSHALPEPRSSTPSVFLLTFFTRYSVRLIPIRQG